MVCIFASCSDGGGEEPITPTPKPEEVKTEITIDSGIISNGLSFSSAEGEQSVSFSVNADWTLSIASTTSGTTWCKASAISGSKGTANVKFTVSENTDYEDRSVSVTIKAGTVSKTFTITQKGADALLVTTTKYEVAQEGGQIEIEVKANIDYKMEISEEAKGWIKESSGRALTTYKHKLDIAMNEDAEKREGEITFKSGDKVETVKVYQAGGAILLLSQNEYNVSDKGDTISVDIKSNIDFGVQLPDVDWIVDEASSRGLSSHTLKYIVSANEGYDSRSAEIIFYDKNSDLKDTLKVAQAQKNAIILSEKEFKVSANECTIEIELNANVEYQIFEECSWIELLNSQKRTLQKECLKFKVERNISTNIRIGNIYFENEDKFITDSLTIIQNGDILLINVDNAGSLPSLIKDEDKMFVKSLKLTGVLNGTDIKYIREMSGSTIHGDRTNGMLSYLDLTEVNIVEGGDSYFWDHRTKNNEISNEMFSYCRQLKIIMLPKELTRIGISAFNGCINLTSVSISEGIKIIDDCAFSACYKLSSFNIPNSIEVIGEGVFMDCQSLIEIYIPKNVKSIDGNIFTGCDNLEKIDVDIENKWYASHNGALYNMDLTELISYPLNNKQIEIYNGTKSINEFAFYENSLITSCILPNGLENIKEYAFADCCNLEKIIFSVSLKRIEDSAFWLCHKLESINIPKNVEYVSRKAFSICGKLETIDVDLSNSTYSSYEGVLYDKKMVNLLMCPEGKETVKICDGVKRISDYAFDCCYELKGLSIPNSITDIGVAAFNDCSSLESVVMSKNVSVLKESIFRNCVSLKSFVVPENITKIEDFALAGCSGLVELKVYHKTPLEIKSNCFSGVDKNKCVLYVPKGSEEYYMATKYWSEFMNVKTIE